MTGRPKHRRRVEIYFILYLCALVLLLPEHDGPSVEGNVVGKIEALTAFQLQPEKTTLVCRVVRDTNGTYRFVDADTTNLIRVHGNVADVRFEYVIEDLSARQTVSMQANSTSGSSMFSMVDRPDLRGAEFRWHPPTSNIAGNTLLVRVIGSATPVIGTEALNGGDRQTVASNLQVRAETQFTLSVVIDDGQSTPQTIIVQQPPSTQQDPATQPGTLPRFGEFWLQPQRERLSELPGARWSNRVSVGGADLERDLKTGAQVRVNGDQRTARSVTIRNDVGRREFVLEGDAPMSGSAVVEIVATRTDNAQAVTRFTVNAQPLPAPSVPDVMYPGIAYTIKANVPVAEGHAIAVVLRDDRRDVARTNGEDIVYTPSVNDTTRVFYLDRLIDGQRVGGSETVRVISFPPPEITNVQDATTRDGERVKRVTVLYYGEANRPTLEVVDGNARPPRKLFGNNRPADRNERPRVKYLEEFDVMPKDASRAFTFRIRAVDGRRFSSSTRTIE